MTNESGYLFCNFPCPIGYYYQSGDCTKSCQGGALPKNETDFLFCEPSSEELMTPIEKAILKFVEVATNSVLIFAGVG
jgi:hypothetical protein